MLLEQHYQTNPKVHITPNEFSINIDLMVV